MICQNCQATVDNDLIFCTNCGERLPETKSESQTVLLKDSVVTKTSIEKPPKPSSNRLDIIFNHLWRNYHYCSLPAKTSVAEL